MSKQVSINDVKSVLRLLDCVPGDRSLRTLCIGSDGDAFVSVIRVASCSQIHPVDRHVANKIINDHLVVHAFYGNNRSLFKTYRLNRRGLLRLHSRR